MGFEQGRETFGIPETKSAAGWIAKSFFPLKVNIWNAFPTWLRQSLKKWYLHQDLKAGWGEGHQVNVPGQGFLVQRIGSGVGGVEAVELVIIIITQNFYNQHC